MTNRPRLSPRRIVLVTPFEGHELQRIRDTFGPVDLVTIRTAADLATFVFGPHDVLVTYGTGVIVSKRILATLSNPAYNFHPGAPDYPGLDPHHLATYDGVRIYSATAHVLVERIDAGPIVGVEQFNVPADCRPMDLLALANQASFRLLTRLGPQIASGTALPMLEGAFWGHRRSSGHRYIEACRVSPLVSERELIRRLRAFDRDQCPLTVQIHGRNFAIQQHLANPPRKRHDDGGFTEAAFEALLRQLQEAGYAIVPRDQFGSSADSRVATLHHDVMYSAHRAARLAEIGGGIGSFFVDMRSPFFDTHDPDVRRSLRRIRATGSLLGLHVSSSLTCLERKAVRDAVQRDRRRLEEACAGTAKVASVGLRGDLFNSGMAAQKLSVKDCSWIVLLRGRWWFRAENQTTWSAARPNEIIAQCHRRLGVAFDPVWCTPEPLSAKECIERCILGRARAMFESAGLNELHWDVARPAESSDIAEMPTGIVKLDSP